MMLEKYLYNFETKPMPKCYWDGIRFLDRDKNEHEEDMFDDWWEEQINLYGVEVDYQIHGYSLSSHDFLYGEDPTQRYHDPIKIIMLTSITNDSLLLSKFGIQSNADFYGLIHIKGFMEKVGPGSEPKSGDLITMTEAGRRRPSGRGPEVFEITERDDQRVGETSQLMGHYVWTIHAKRYDYSFEDNGTREKLLDQVYDGRTDGLLAGFNQPASPAKKYPQNVVDESKKIFEYGKNNIDTSPYGDYDT